MSEELSAAGHGSVADPTVVKLEFGSDGRMAVWTCDADGNHAPREFTDTPVASLLVITANPGGTGRVNALGAHDVLTKQGAYFRIEIQRIY